MPHKKDQPRQGRKQPMMVLPCKVGNHEGVFPITRTEHGWACPQHGGQP